MLKRFAVSNFKNFKNRIELNLGNPCNYEFNEECVKPSCITKGIIYGINGSGKSNLALALFDIIHHLTDKEKLRNKYEPYLNLNSNLSFAEFEYEFEFYEKTVIYKYAKRNPMQLVYEQLFIDGEKVVSYDFRENEGETTLKGAETLNLISATNPISRVKYLNSNAILEETNTNKIFYSFMSFVDRMLMFYSLDEKGYQGFLSGSDSFTQGIIRENKTKDFENFLKSQGINYTLVEREVNGKKELCCHFDNVDVNFMIVASTGTKSLALFYYWYIAMKKASFVWVDEFDAFYHFELAEAIVEMVKGLKNTQVLFSTHNTDLMSNDLLRPDCYFLLEDGKIDSLNNLTDKDLRKAHNIQKMYKAGSFNE